MRTIQLPDMAQTRHAVIAGASPLARENRICSSGLRRADHLRASPKVAEGLPSSGDHSGFVPSIATGNSSRPINSDRRASAARMLAVAWRNVVAPRCASSV